MSELALMGDGDTVTIRVACPGTLIGSGAAGLVRYGFNQHAWAWNKGHYDSLGAKCMRIGGAGLARFKSFGAYPGPAFSQANQNYNWVLQQCVDGAVRDGFVVILCVTNPDYTLPTFDDFAALCAAVAQANLNNVDSVIIEPGNEPNFNSFGGDKYAKMLLQCSAAIRAVSPKFKIGGPTINASYVGNAVNFANKMMATPGIERAFDIGTFHPYYHTPENCYATDLNAFIQRIDTVAVARGRSDLEYAADEVGFSNAMAWMTNNGIDITKENLGGLGSTFVQNEEVSADYYSRLIPIMRSTAKLRYVAFYALSDEGSRVDPTGLNIQAHFGVSYEGTRALKPQGKVCADLFPHVHRATGASMFHRNDRWYTRLDVPGSQELIAWGPDGPRDDYIFVDAPAGANLSINVAGAASAAVTQALPPGRSAVKVKLGQRSLVLYADRQIRFPEF